MLRIRELRCNVDLRASAIAVARDASPDPVTQGHQGVARCSRPRTDRIVPLLPELVVFALEERLDERILGREMAVDRGLGDARLVDDALHADGANTFAVEERGGRV